MIRRTSVVVVTVALAWLYLAGGAYAQIVTGTILGTVTDESRAVLPGVTATIISPVLPGGPQTIATDTKGAYRGVVNVVTKSGTNKYEGDFTAYWKPNSLHSQSIKVNCNCPDGQNASTWER